MNEQQLIDTMTRVARECGGMILAAGGGEVPATEKSSFRDLVTAYDVRVQEYAVRALADAFPGAAFICEEGAPEPAGPAELTFVIDPIDGTANFVHHFRHSCTSIACLHDGQLAAGAVYDPYADEMFSASLHGGACLNGRRLRLHPRPLSESLVLFGTSPYNGECDADTFARVRDLYGRCQDVRRSGSAALDLCYVAAGRAGLFFEESLSLWDYAAGALIVTEAGGVCSTMAGTPLPLTGKEKSSCLAGNTRAVRESGLPS